MTRISSFSSLLIPAILLSVASLTLQGQGLSPTTVPDTSVGASYNVPISVPDVSCSGYTWSVSGGTPPPGLTVAVGDYSETSSISGVAGQPSQDVYTFTVTAVCEGPGSVQTYSIRVLAIQNPTTPLPNGFVGQPYSYSFAAWGRNPSVAATWNATGLPPGLSISASGQITGTPTTAGTYAGTVTVTEGPRSASRPISIVIGIPLSFSTPASLPGATVGVPYSATIQTFGGTPPVTIVAEISPVAYGLSYNASTRTISGTPNGAGTYSIELFAYDANQATVFRTFTVVIVQPPGVITTSLLPSGTIQVAYTATLTSSGFNSPPTWSASGLPPGLTLNSSTGVISGVPTSLGVYPVTVGAASSVQTAVPKTLPISIGPPELDFTPGVLPSGVVGTAYNAKFTATGGEGDYVFAAVGAGLPPGLVLSTSGAVTGTPTQAGDFRFSVRVTSGRSVIEKLVSMTIEASPLELTPSVLAPGYTGQPYSQTFVVSGGTAPYVFQLGASSSVPPGMALSSAGVLAGTPTTAGTFRFIVQVSDYRQRSLQRDYSLTVLAGGTISTTSLPDGIEGEAYSAVIETSGGTAPFAYDLAAGALPPGLSLSAAGAITGTPTTAGRFTMTFRSTDANHYAATRELSIQVFAAISIAPATLPNAALLKDYSAQLTASGGQPPYIWQVTNGALPDGIQFADGALRGSATRAGTFGFDVTVTDQRKRSVTKRYSIVVAEGPSIQIDGTVPDGVVGVPYSVRFTAKGGRAPFRWSVSGQLPAGLTLGAADGSITGTPTTVGVSNFTLRLEDADGLAASSPIRISVVAGTVPNATITGISGTSAPSNQLTFGITTSAPFPTDLDGAVVLTFRPDSGADDPAVLFSNGIRRMTFTVPAGSTTASFPVGRAAVQTGTVAGLITMTGSFNINGTDVTPQPAPVSTLRVEPAAPVITRMDAVRTSTGFELSIYGFATSRQITSAQITLTPTAGFTLAGTQFTIDLGTSFSTYYASTASAPFGSQFKLVLPFTLSDPLAVASVSVTLVNGQGSSAASSATF